jgi:hypothetical protein
MSWADEASKEAVDAAEQRNAALQELPGMWEASDFESPDFESHRPVDEECPCEEGHGGEKCSNTNLVQGTGMCTPCINGCMP